MVHRGIEHVSDRVFFMIQDSALPVDSLDSFVRGLPARACFETRSIQDGAL